jgi:hypothetical protein
MTDYDNDFYAWAVEQAALLRQRKFDQIDIANVAEEIESLAREEKRLARDRLIVLLTQLLRWQVQPAWRCTKWALRIREQRLRLRQDHLADNPTLHCMLPQIIASAWPIVVLRAVRKTGLNESAFPKQCPWTVDYVLDGPLQPEVPAER